MNMKNYDLDELDEKFPKTEKIKKNDKKKNDNAKRFHKLQGGTPDWREGDSHIGRQKKARGKIGRLI